MSPLSTDHMPVGITKTIVSGTQRICAHLTCSRIGARARPGCTRYQWPSSIASGKHPEEECRGDTPQDRQEFDTFD